MEGEIVRVIIDTGVLWYPSVLEGLSGTERDIILPVVAYSERVRQLIQSGRKERELSIILDAVGIMVEPLGLVESVKFSAAIGDDSWERLARDAYIAGHIRDGDEIWTTNPKDFLQLGVPSPQVVAVP